MRRCVGCCSFCQTTDGIGSELLHIRMQGLVAKAIFIIDFSKLTMILNDIEPIVQARVEDRLRVALSLSKRPLCRTVDG